LKEKWSGDRRFLARTSAATSDFNRQKPNAGYCNDLFGYTSFYSTKWQEITPYDWGKSNQINFPKGIELRKCKREGTILFEI
jgi:hypothetical protein